MYSSLTLVTHQTTEFACPKNENKGDAINANTLILFNKTYR